MYYIETENMLVVFLSQHKIIVVYKLLGKLVYYYVLTSILFFSYLYFLIENQNYFFIYYFFLIINLHKTKHSKKCTFFEYYTKQNQINTALYIFILKSLLKFEKK